MMSGRGVCLVENRSKYDSKMSLNAGRNGGQNLGTRADIANRVEMMKRRIVVILKRPMVEGL